MDSYLIGGTSNLAEVGLEWSGGKLKLPTWTIQFNQGSLVADPAWSTKGSGALMDQSYQVLKYDARGTGPFSIHLVMRNPNDTNGALMSKVQHLPDQGSYNPQPLSDVVPKYLGISGLQTIGGDSLSLGDPSTNTRHVKCRWIVRIR
jgi:hypothetical protein